MKVYKAGRRLPAGKGISSLLANPQWAAEFNQGERSITQTLRLCSRKSPFFVCSTIEAAIAVGTLPAGRLPEGTIVEVWEAEASDILPTLPWVPHPDPATPEWFLFWQSVV